MNEEFKENKSQVTVIVTGTVRSGTSVMMRMLHNADVKALFDNQKRPADISNPYGYFEYPEIRSLQKDYHIDTASINSNEWLDEAIGGAVKILPNNLIEGLPNDRKYAVIFMKRDFYEVAESYRLYLQNRPGRLTESENSTSTKKPEFNEEFIEKWSRIFSKTSKKAYDYIKSHPDNFSIIEVELSELNEQIGEVSKFVSDHLEREINLIVPPKNY